MTSKDRVIDFIGIRQLAETNAHGVDLNLETKFDARFSRLRATWDFPLLSLWASRYWVCTMSRQILDRIDSYQSIIWDWNGTLINDSTIGGAAEAEIFRRYGLPAQTYEERQRNFFMPIEKYYEKMGFDFSKVPYEKVSEEWLSIYEQLVKEARLFEGVSEMLEELCRAGKRQFVLSAAPETHLHEIVAKHSITHCFDAIYGLPNALADSKVLRGAQLIEDQEISPASAILIGDTTHDFEVGQALGVDVLLVADGHHSLEALQEVHHNVLPSRFIL